MAWCFTWINVGTDLGSYDGIFNGTCDSMMEISILGVPLGSSDGESFGFGDGITLGSAVGEVLVSTLGDADEIGMGSSDGSFGGSNNGKPKGVLLGV